MENEIWVKHPIFNLQVSSLGNIKGPRGPRKPRFDRYGYLRINLLHQGKHITKTIHRLVADCFIQLCSTLTVDHIDGDKTNNCVLNLQLLPSGENASKAFKDGDHSSCMKVEIDGIEYYSKREAERCTGIPRKRI